VPENRTVPELPRPLPPRPLARRGPIDELAGRLATLTRDPRAPVIALVVVALAAGIVFYRVGARTGPHTVALRAATPRRSRTAAAHASPITTAPRAGPDRRVLVDVAGAVVHPGVVRLAAGARVVDAVTAAGGALPDADLDRVNLAAKVADGAQIVVVRHGDPSAGITPGITTGASAAANGSGTAAPANTGPLNLNTATGDQLELLPGVGPALARAIIAERTRRGGFRSVNELRSVHGIGDRRFADLRPLVAV